MRIRRTSELLLAIVGAAVVLAVAAAVWYTEAGNGGITWPLPGLVLLELGICGPIGLAAALRDSGPMSRPWGLLTWAVTGTLGAIMLLGALSIGPLIFPAVVAFGAAAMLADWRQQRSIRVHLGLGATFGVCNGLLVVALAVLARS